jgi:hypothetical protein
LTGFGLFVYRCDRIALLGDIPVVSGPCNIDDVFKLLAGTVRSNLAHSSCKVTAKHDNNVGVVGHAISARNCQMIAAILKWEKTMTLP